MKKIFYYLLGFLFVFLPLSVNASSGTVSLDCPSSAKKGSTVTCNVILNVTDGTINHIAGTVSGGTYFEDGGAFNVTGEYTGSNVIIGTTSVVSKSTAGTGTISLNITEATYNDNSSGSIIVTPATVTPLLVTDNVKVLNNDKTLTDIQIDGKSISTYSGQTFSSGKLEYSINVEKTSLLNVTATLNDPKASISGTGKHDLKCGINIINLNVSAEDSTSNIYKLTVNRSCNSSTTLKKITLSTGSLNPTFVGSTRNYTVNVSKDIEKITINADPNDSTQKITGLVKNKVLEFGENKITIQVTSESGTTGTYTITVNREDSRSTNNNLSDLKLSDGKLIFNKETIEYTTKVLNNVTKIDITATPEDKTSKVEIIGDGSNLKVGENSITIKVTAEHGEVKEYKLLVNRLEEGQTLGDNPNVESLKIGNYDILFNPNITEYTLKIENENTLDIRVALEEKTASYVIKGNEELKDGSIIIIKVTSEDGTTKDYKIVIEKSNSTMIFIIAGVCFLVAIGLIVYLITKNKKNPDDKVTTNKIKNKLKSEEEILSKVEQQLKQIESKEKELAVTKPISIVPEQVKDITPKTIKEVEIVEDKYDNDEKPVGEVTKICSICGHRVPISLKTCPYCKRNF